MVENNLNLVFQRPADEGKDGKGHAEKHVERVFVEETDAGMKSADFEQAAKADAMLDRVSNKFEQAVKAYAMFDRILKGRLWEGERA